MQASTRLKRSCLSPHHLLLQLLMLPVTMQFRVTQAQRKYR